VLDGRPPMGESARRHDYAAPVLESLGDWSALTLEQSDDIALLHALPEDPSLWKAVDEQRRERREHESVSFRPSVDVRRCGRAPDVITTDFDDDVVLLDPRTGKMFALNETGRRVWLGLPAAVTQLADSLCARFAVDPHRATADVTSLLIALSDAGLIVNE
jgi:hypothetical protein